MAKQPTNQEKQSAHDKLVEANGEIGAATLQVGVNDPGWKVTDTVVDALDKAKGLISVALTDLGGKPCGGGKPC